MFEHRPLFDHRTPFRMFVLRQRRRFPFRVVRQRRRRHCNFSVLGWWRHLTAIGVSVADRCVLQVVKLKRTSPTQRSWHELWLLTGADCDLSDAIKPRTRHKSLLALRTAHGGEYKTTNIYLCILNCLHFIFILHFLCIDVCRCRENTVHQGRTQSDRSTSTDIVFAGYWTNSKRRTFKRCYL